MTKSLVKTVFNFVLVLTILAVISLFSKSLTLFWVAVFFASIYLLIQSADYFTEYAEKLGKIMGIPPMIIGVTIVALGTSLPELATSIIAVLKGSTEFVAGNAIGSNIANILLVLGIASLVARSLKVEWDLIKIDLPLLFASAFLLTMVALDGKITMAESIIGILAYIIYIWYGISLRKEGDKAEKDPNAKRNTIIAIVALIISAVGIYFSANYTVKSVLSLSVIFGFADTSALALSVVALGTSLPEVFVSIQAVRKGQFELAVGNVLGSNIFNTFIVIGIPGLITTLIVPTTVLIIGLPFMIGATLLYIFSTLDKEISMFEGMTFLVVYALFMGKLFGIF